MQTEKKQTKKKQPKMKISKKVIKPCMSEERITQMSNTPDLYKYFKTIRISYDKNGDEIIWE